MDLVFSVTSVASSSFTWGTIRGGIGQQNLLLGFIEDMREIVKSRPVSTWCVDLGR